MQIDRYNNVEVAETVETSGYFESLFEVYCPLSNGRVKRSKNADLAGDFVSRGFRVSVSNDGNGYSDEDSIVIFDSQCVDCSKVNGKIVCTTKTGFCMKGGKCFHPGDKVGCQICKTSSFGYSHWENGPDCLTPVATEENETLWIIGAVLGAFVFILLSVIAVMCYLSKRGRTPIQKIKLVAEIR
ncbi:von Willebrand factor D and EGF domain-containing protein-like [Ruditapes philippinarum]|uniref:von Willebrand factor D and EGF domain-containing protein-like n=1 Tax=Ruditapes philippinarum TaxID=129788 RepID=UPI00295AA776|nr:von Willebrand factor D and EGF domain-containing protein-like [Ruditapes philippinarum]